MTSNQTKLTQTTVQAPAMCHRAIATVHAPAMCHRVIATVQAPAMCHCQKLSNKAK